MFDTYLKGVEHNYSIQNVIEGHLSSINEVLRSFQGQTLKHLLYRIATHVSYLI